MTQVLLGAILLAVPAWMVVRLLPARTGDAQDRAAAKGIVAVTVAWGLVTAPAFALRLLAGISVSVTSIAATSIVASLILFLALRRRGPVDPPRPCRPTAPIVAALIVALVYLLSFDDRSHATESCISETAYAAVGARTPNGDLEPDVDLLGENIEDARLGNTAVLATSLALFGNLGFRLMAASCGLLLALSGWLIGGACAGPRPGAAAPRRRPRAGDLRRVGAWFGLILLPLNPYVLSLPQLDENLLGLSFLSGAIVWLTRREDEDDVPAQWLLAGLLFGVAVTMRHVLAPGLLAVLTAAWWTPGPNRRRAARVAFLLVGVAVATALENLHHLLALGSLLRFESNSQFPPFDYSLLGWSFHYEGLMNWPLHTDLVRTPHNPFPWAMTWPLLMTDSLGALLAGSAVVGLSVGLARRERALLLLAALVGPTMVAVSLQEGWDTHNRMWIAILWLPPVIGGAVRGLTVAAHHRVGAAALVAATVLCWAGPRGLRGWEVPPDPRYCQLQAGGAPEHPQLLALDAAEITAPGLLPNLRQLGHNGPFLHPGKLRSLAWALSNPELPTQHRPWGWFPSSTEPGPVRVLELDLRRAPWGRSDWIRLVDPALESPPVALDLTASGAGRPRAWTEVQTVVDWTPAPLTVAGAAGDRHSGVVAVFFDGPGLPGCAPGARAEELTSLRCGAMGVFTDRPELQAECESTPRSPAAVADPLIYVRARSGDLSVVVERSLGPDRVELWPVTIHADGRLDVEPPREPWDN